MGRHRIARLLTAGFLVLGGLAGSAPEPLQADERLAGVVLSGESANAARRLEAIRKLVAEKNWSEAVEEYQRFLEAAGGDLVPISAEHCVQARWLIHLDLAALPADALRLYRGRVDEQARKWFEQGSAARDERLLRRVVHEAFCSHSAAQALDLLGDLAFEKARYADAESWWRMLVLPASEKKPAEGALGLVYPEPPADVALVRAKQLLARLHRGDTIGITGELQAFVALHPRAEGQLAGRKGNLGEILQALVREDRPLSPPASDRWPTFAGAATRNGLIAGHLDPERFLRLCRDGPHWRFDLERHGRLDADTPLPRVPRGEEVAASRSLAFHPAIVGDHVLVADARCLTAYNLRTGESRVWYDLDESKRRAPKCNLKLPAPADLRYTITVAEDHVLLRLGSQRVAPLRHERTGETEPAGERDSFLVCLAVQPDRRGQRLRWTVKLPEPAEHDKPIAIFEGAPIVQDGRVYVAVTQVSGSQRVTTIHCYPLRSDKDSAPPPLWKQEVCAAKEEGLKEPRLRHHLLTLAGPNVVYASHSGAVVALDALTGQRVWGLRYPSRGLQLSSDEPTPRDLVPCLYGEGRLYAAPLDYDRLLCLDPATGKVLWERQHTEVVQLLGATGGRLFFTAQNGNTEQGTPQYGIRAVRASTGADEWYQPGVGNGTLPPAGRGLLAGDVILLPTPGRLLVLRQEDGEHDPAFYPLPLRPFRGGNLAYADGCLAVAGTTELDVYVAPRRLKKEREAESRAHPQAPLSRYRLALAEMDDGLFAEAISNFKAVAQLAGPQDRLRGQPLKELADAQRFAAFLRQGRQANQQQDRHVAAAALVSASAAEFPASARLRALARLSDLWLAAEQPERALAVWQAVLADEELSHGTLHDVAGNPQNGRSYALVQIDQMIQRHGRACYAAAEQQARAILAASSPNRRAEQLTRLLHEFPHALATRALALEGARRQERTGQGGAAARAYRCLLHRGCAGDDRAIILAGLGRAYEQQGCWTAARASWQALSADAGDRTVVALDASQSVRDFAQGRLVRATAPRGDLEKTGLFMRRWQVMLPAAEQPMCPAADQDTLRDLAREWFSVSAVALTCRESSSGRTRWARTLNGQVGWLGRYADLIVAAGPTEIRALSVADGEEVWRLAVPCTDSDGSMRRDLSGFHLAGSRLFCLEGDCRLLALSLETGQVLWGRWAPAALLPRSAGGGFTTEYLAGEQSLVIQTARHQALVLDAASGRSVWADYFKSGVGGASPPRAPLPISSKMVCLVKGPGEIAALDLATGKIGWTYAAGQTTTLAGQWPHLLARGQRLLVLHARNYGHTAQLLDTETGKPCWSAECLLGTGRVGPETLRLDADRLFCLSDGVLSARALTDQKLLWEVAMAPPAMGWRLFGGASGLLDRYLVVHTAGEKTGRFQFRWGLWAVQWTMSEPPGLTGQAVPVLLIERTTGQVVQCLNFAPAIPRLTVQVGWSKAWTAQPSVVRGRPAATSPPLVLPVSGGVVVVGRNAWGLSVRSDER